MNTVGSAIVERFLVNGSTTTTPDLPAAVAAFFETVAERSWEIDEPEGFSPSFCVMCPNTPDASCMDCPTPSGCIDKQPAGG